MSGFRGYNNPLIRPHRTFENWQTPNYVPGSSDYDRGRRTNPFDWPGPSRYRAADYGRNTYSFPGFMPPGYATAFNPCRMNPWNDPEGTAWGYRGSREGRRGGTRVRFA